MVLLNNRIYLSTGQVNFTNFMALSIIFMLIMLQSLSPLLTPIQTHIYLYFHLVSLAFHIYNDQQIQTNETIKTNNQTKTTLLLSLPAQTIYSWPRRGARTLARTQVFSVLMSHYLLNCSSPKLRSHSQFLLLSSLRPTHQQVLLSNPNNYS